MTSSLSLVPSRGLRKWLDTGIRYRPPIPNYRRYTGIHKASKRVMGFEYHEVKDHPQGRGDSSYPITPKFMGNNHPDLKNYMYAQMPGYEHPVTGEFMHVPEMVPEIIVPPHLHKPSKLKPYVSYRVDDMIEEDRAKGTFKSEPLTAEALFRAQYQTDVEKAFDNGEYDDPNYSVFKSTQETSDVQKS